MRGWLAWSALASVLCLHDSGGAAAASPHPLHLSTAQLALETDAAYLRIRIFKDDLEDALARFAERDSLALQPTAELDSLFLSYFRNAFDLWCDAGCEAPEILSSGEDFESGQGDERMWWYLLRFPAAGQVSAIRVRNAVLYDLFGDQRNIVRVLHSQTDSRRTLYFAAPDEDPQSLAFG